MIWFTRQKPETPVFHYTGCGGKAERRAGEMLEHGARRLKTGQILSLTDNH